MKIPTHEEMLEMLELQLASGYEDEYVELGENWEVIAEVFFKAGFEAGRNECGD